MAHYELHTRPVGGAVPLSTLISWRVIRGIESAMAYLREAWIAHKTRRALLALADWQLADIGLTRSRVERMKLHELLDL